MSLLGLLQLVLLAFLVFTLAGAGLSSRLYPLARERFRSWEPSRRARATLVWIGSPFLFSGFLILLCLAPSMVASVTGGLGDHCLAHGDGHVHLCLRHPPASPGSLLGWTILATAVIVLGTRTSRHGMVLWRARRALGSIRELSRRDPDRPLAWLPGDAPIALTVGVLVPQILVARALRDQLPARLLEGVLEHELAHVRRHDVRLRALASFLALVHPRRTRRILLADFHLACEQAADAEAARTLDDPLRVAEAILAVERLAGTKGPHAALACAFGEHDVSARVEALLDPPIERARPRVSGWLGAVLLIGLLVAESLHHAVETLLTPVTR